MACVCHFNHLFVCYGCIINEYNNWLLTSRLCDQFQNDIQDVTVSTFSISIALKIAYIPPYTNYVLKFFNPIGIKYAAIWSRKYNNQFSCKLMFYFCQFIRFLSIIISLLIHLHFSQCRAIRRQVGKTLRAIPKFAFPPSASITTL